MGEYADEAFNRLENHYCMYNKNHHNTNKQLDKPSGKGKCPKCNCDTVLKEGKFGKFYGCVKFPSCKGSRNL